MERDVPGLRVGEPAPSLVRWGLSPNADLVYRALLAVGTGTNRYLARDLGMPAGRVASAVDELVAAGAVASALPRSPRRGQAVPPEPRWRPMPVNRVVEVLRRRRLRAPDRTRRMEFHQAIVGGVALPRGPHSRGLRARHLADLTETRPRITELVAAERYEHLALHPERSFAPDAAAAALPLDRQLIARGVAMRMCGVPPDDRDASCGAAQQLAAIGGEYREHERVPLKLMIFDRRVALLPVDPLDLTAGALEIDQPSVVEALVILFEQIWSSAGDPRKGGVVPVALTVREQAIIGLLARGYTDASAAQRLGLSTRTIAYTLRGLMDRLGVENRFQLGLALGAMHAAVPPLRAVETRASGDDAPEPPSDGEEEP